MQRTFAFLHTSAVLIPQFAELAGRFLNDYRVFHMVDESLIKNTIEAGALTRTTVRRTIGMIGLAREGGADAVMVTCSSIGPAAALARSVFDFPIFRIDEAMAERAISSGRRIGVAATLRTTLDPTVGLLQETAARGKRAVDIVSRVSDGAFEALLSGNRETHDSLVRSMLEELARDVDVIVLAQASMAGVLGSVNLNGTPVLSSPEIALRKAAEVLSRVWLQPA